MEVLVNLRQLSAAQPRNWGAPSSGRRFHNFPFGLSSFTKPEVAYENDVGNSFDGTMADKWTLLLVTF